MSDMSAVEVIARVQLAHRWCGDFLGCGCSWNWPEPRTYFCGEDDRISRAHAHHVAAEVDKALGGLTREVSKGTRVCSLAGAEHEGMAHGHWVGGWTPEEAS